HPLEVGFLTDASHMLGMKGYPWPALRDRLTQVKIDAPPDTGKPTAEDARKATTRLVERIKITVPPGHMMWPDLFARIKSTVEAKGIKVTTGAPAVSDTWGLDIPARDDWTADSLIGFVFYASREDIHFRYTSEGVVLGTAEAVNRGVR